MRVIICNDHPLRLLQINSLICHENPIKGHNNGVITLHPILRATGIVGMIEIITDPIACIMGMIDETTSMIEDIATMIGDTITMAEDITLTRELLGYWRTMMLTGEDFLLFHQYHLFQTISKHHQPQRIIESHQILH